MSTRFLNVSPRAYIRQKDSVNILPPIIRTGYQNELGIKSEPFSDKDTIVFKENATLRAPYMIPTPLAIESGFSVGDLNVTGTLQDKTAYLEKKIVNDPIHPFEEGQNSSNPAAYDSSQDEGFPESKFPGFSSPDSDKSAIVIDLTARQASQITKVSVSDAARDSSGPFFGQAKSGFMYYDFSTRRWTDQGIRDPVRNTLLSYSPVFELSHVPAFSRGENIIDDGGKFLSQFSSSPYSITSEGSAYSPKSIDALKARGYDKIGEPTAFFDAPSGDKYHANENECIRMSNFIDAPFVVDRISVNLPVVATRTQTPQTGSAMFDFGFGRDIDNYTFFVYIQNRTGAPRDLISDVSSSLRYLVAKESFCFYNSPTLDLVSSGTIPIHDSGQSFDFGMQSNEATTAGRAVTKSISTNINLSFRPKSFNSNFGTISKFAGIDSTSPNPYTGSVFVTNYWKGGQTYSGSLPGISLVNGTKNLNTRTGSDNFTNFDPSILPSARALATSYWIGTSARIQSGSGLGTSGNEIQTVSDYQSSQETPVVIFPEDDLVFGIESGVNPNILSPGRGYDGIDNDVLLMTGSRLQIRAGGASIVLYGTMLAENKEKLPVLNQHLGSDAVQESIQEYGPFDQFDIYDKSRFYNSYVANIFRGSFFEGNRQKFGTVTIEAIPLSGSFQRNAKLFSTNNLYYDTLIPAVAEISGGLANTAQEDISRFIDPSTLKIVADSSNGYAPDNNRENSVLLKRSWTYENHAGSKRLKNIRIRLYGPSGAFVEALTGDRARIFLYYNGSNKGVAGFSNQKQYTGAASLRYGLMNPRLVGPSSIFRRDSYGQFRDMLEQSRDGKIVTPGKNRDTVGAAVVVATFVSASSDTIAVPEDTQCSNLSFECTSSVPFIDDGQTHNRGQTPQTIVRFGANNLLFGITGSFGFNN